MSETDLQLGGGYTYQWECAILLALNYFFEPVRYNPILFNLINDFLGQVAEIHLEGEDRESGVDLEDINLVNGDRRILIQVKTKQADGERWTPTDPLFLKALYRFYYSRFLAEQPEDTCFVFLTNRPFNPDLVQVKAAISEGTVAQCAEADKLCQHLARYARKEKGESVDVGRFREMLARTALVEYLAVDEVKANVQAKLQAHGRHDWEQAHALLFEHFARQSTRIGGGTVTRASAIEVLGPPSAAEEAALTPEKRQELTRTYLDKIADDCRYVEPRDLKIPLIEVFVMLQAVEKKHEEPFREDFAPLKEREREAGFLDRLFTYGKPGEVERAMRMRVRPASPPPPPPVELSKALQEHDHLVLLGEPGAGKTTTLQYIALLLAEGRGEELGLDRDLIPVRLNLREYGEGLGEWRLDEFLRGCLHRYYVSPEQANAWQEEGKLILLFDALDEVRPEDRQRSMLEAIRNFSLTPEGKRTRIVLSSRLPAYRATTGIGGDFGHYIVCPFTKPEEALPYTANWFAVLEELSSEEAKARAQELLDEMQKQPGLRRVVSNPLLLRLAIEVYLQEGETVSSRAGLYKRYVEETRRRAKLREDPSIWKIDIKTEQEEREALETALETIAWKTFAEGEYRKDALCRAVEEKLAVNDHKKVDGTKLVDYLRNAMGLLILYLGEKEEELFIFSHFSFCEYSVALHLARCWRKDEKRTWRFLKPRLHHPHWREPILLLAMMIGEESTTELIQHILKAKSPYEQELHRDLLLVGEGLGNRVQMNSRLRCTILDKLLQLYLSEVTFETTCQFITQPVEEIFSSLGDDGRADIITSLLAIAKEEDRVERLTPGKVVARLVFATQVLVHLIRAFLSGFVRTRDIRGIREVILFPAHLKKARSRRRTLRRRAVIKALGNLKLGTPETIPLLLAALEDVLTRDVAAETLGKTGPGTAEVVTALIDAQDQHRHVYRWDQTVNRIIEALGILGQRHPKAVELLLDIAKSPEPDPHDIRYAVTYALCKSAETDPHAMAFVLEGWRNLYREWHIGRVLDEGVREGLKEGRRLISSASPQVIRYLLKVIRDYDDRRIRDTAGGFFARVVGDSPLVQCKVVEKDGSFRYRTLDLTEELFDIFLRRPPYSTLHGNVALFLLLKWGINRPNLIVRLINVFREADPWFLASIIEEEWLSQDQALELKLSEETIASLRQSIARLRNPDKAIRDAELSGWLAAAQSELEDNWYLKYLPHAIDSSKCRILNDAYSTVYRGLWTSRELSRPHLPEEINPYVVAALACFRGWNGTPGFRFDLSLTAEDMREEFLTGTNQALSILQSPDRRAVEILASVLAGEEAKLASGDLEKKLEEEEEQLTELWGEELGERLKKLGRWRERNRPDFQERSAAAYALAQLTSDYPEVQAILISNLKACFWRRRGETVFSETLYSETEVQEHLIRALGHVRHANRDLVAALLEIAAKHDNDVYGAGSEALGRLQNPDPEAVPLLIQGYEELNEWEQSRLIKALGAVEPRSPEIVDLLLSALEDEDEWVRSAAVTELGDLKEPDSKVIDALLASIGRTPVAAVAIGKLVDRITLENWAKMRIRLTKATGTLQKTLRQTLPSDLMRHGLGYDAIYEAFDHVVSRITELEVAALVPEDPCAVLKRTTWAT